LAVYELWSDRGYFESSSFPRLLSIGHPRYSLSVGWDIMGLLVGIFLALMCVSCSFFAICWSLSALMQRALVLILSKVCLRILCTMGFLGIPLLRLVYSCRFLCSSMEVIHCKLVSHVVLFANHICFVFHECDNLVTVMFWDLHLLLPIFSVTVSHLLVPAFMGQDTSSSRLCTLWWQCGILLKTLGNCLLIVEGTIPLAYSCLRQVLDIHVPVVSSILCTVHLKGRNSKGPRVVRARALANTNAMRTRRGIRIRGST